MDELPPRATQQAVSAKLAVAALAAAVARAAVPADLVTNLPGFGAPLSKLYSGYVSAGTNKAHHYVYSESLRDPVNDDLVIWFNGGPGCSSMEGAFSESGLYHIKEFSDPQVLEVNPWSWNNITNNLFIESPAGVGYSYCTSANGCNHDDNSTAADNLAAVVAFFAAYPELQKSKFWITGESYAGIYIPMFAAAIYAYNQAGSGPAINLQGIMVGNGCIGSQAGHCGNDPTGLNDYHDIEIWRGHGLVSETAYDAIIGNCTWDNESNECGQLLNDAADAIGDIDVYYLYNTCADPAITRNLRAPLGNSMLARVVKRRAERGLTLPPDPNCFGTGPTLESWFNTDAVKSALHVAPAITWSLCNSNRTFNYHRSYPDERTTIYPTLTMQAKINVLIYNGEADLCVPHTDNEWWTRSMGYGVTQPWTAWSVPGAEGPYVGGYSIQYENKFTYATVRGAGHMVPEVRPESALALLTSFITTGTV